MYNFKSCLVNRRLSLGPPVPHAGKLKENVMGKEVGDDLPTEEIL